jgi:hypothetical protein
VLKLIRRLSGERGRLGLEKTGDNMSNPILVHAEEVGSSAFDDPRLVKRGQH